MSGKKILVVNRHAPYGSSLAREALDAVLAASVYDQELSLLFVGDGVFQLKNRQDTSALGIKNLAAALPALPLYEVDKFYVQRSALRARGLKQEDLVLPVICLDDEAIAPLMDTQDVLLSF